jgi:hypothetical protein
MNTIDDIVRGTMEGLCLEFTEQPYICYTEHGLHALFFSRLYDALPEDLRYFEWDGRRVCAIQKEYATAHDLGKSRRQHWDIAVLRNPPVTRGEHPYDFFEIDAAVEFGLNEGKVHLLEDMRRLSHPLSNVGTGYAVHLNRISEGLSKRDLSPRSTRIWPGDSPVEKDKLLAKVRKTNVTVYYVLVDSTHTLKFEALVFEESGIHLIGTRGD